MGAIASQITSLTVFYSTVYSDADQMKRKLRVTGLCAGNSPVTGEFSTQMASNAESISIWWRHHDDVQLVGYRYYSQWYSGNQSSNGYVYIVSDWCPCTGGTYKKCGNYQRQGQILWDVINYLSQTLMPAYKSSIVSWSKMPQFYTE